MSILNDALNDYEREAAETYAAGEAAPDQPTPETAAPMFDFSFLKTPTGEGAIESYLDHPLNPEQSRGVAQILRGFTGIAGDLKLAILDIFLGSVNLIKERKQ